MLHLSAHVCAAASLVVGAQVEPSFSGISPELAARYFQEVRWAAADEAAKTWGKSLDGPVLFFDRESGSVVANRADAEHRLTPQGEVFVGHVSNDFAGANTALDWGGVHWTVVLWPLPEDTFERTRLVLHECFHRIQSDVGLPSASVANEHLATLEGRIWLLLEYRALAQALPAWGPERTQALGDALAFRAYRRSLFPNAAKEEDRMEVHEGLAEYTGVANGGLGNHGARYFLAGRLKLAALKPALSYAFAYETGPAYGLMLDMHGVAWRKSLTTSSSLSSLLAAANHLDVGHPTHDDVLKRSVAYDGASLIESETRAARERSELEAKYRRALVTGPVLVLPLSAANQFTFDPDAVIPLGADGKVFSGCRYIDEWGVLEVDGAALAGPQYDKVTVAAPSSASARSGPDWKLELKPGWKLVAGARAGDFTLAKE